MQFSATECTANTIGTKVTKTPDFTGLTGDLADFRRKTRLYLIICTRARVVITNKPNKTNKQQTRRLADVKKDDLKNEKKITIGMGSDFKNNSIYISRLFMKLITTPGLYHPETIWTILNYFGRVNPFEEEGKENNIVGFSKEDMKMITGKEDFRTRDADLIKDDLLARIDIKTTQKTGRRNKKIGIVLFPIAGYDYDDDTDEVQRFYIGCALDSKLKGYFYRISKYIVTKQGLISGLNNRDSGWRTFFLYCYLLDNMYKGRWRVDIDYIKDMMDCPASRRKSTSTFNRDILFPIVDYINDYMNLSVTFEPKQSGEGRSHRYTYYEIECFERIPLDELFAKEEPKLSADPEKEVTDEKADIDEETIKRLMALTGDTFTVDEIKEIYEKVCDIIPHHSEFTEAYTENLRDKVIRACYRQLLNREDQGKVNISRFGLFMSLFDDAQLVANAKRGKLPSRRNRTKHTDKETDVSSDPPEKKEEDNKGQMTFDDMVVSRPKEASGDSILDMFSEDDED